MHPFPSQPLELRSRPETVPSADVIGVPLALTDYERTLDWIDDAAASGARAYVCVAATHTVVACAEDPDLRAAVLGADFTVPDGQPLVWALRALGHRLSDRVYGPTLMEEACARAAATGRRFYLYGGRNHGAHVDLGRKPRRRVPGVGSGRGHAPPLRPRPPGGGEAGGGGAEPAAPPVEWVRG